MVGGQIHRVLGAKSGLAQGVNQPVGGQRLAARRAHRDPVAQRERLRPQAVHPRAVAGGVHREHLAAPRPHRAAVAGALLAPVGDRAHRPGRPHRVERRGDGVGDAAGSGAGDRDRQPRNPAGQADIGLEIQPGDDPGREDIGRFDQCRFALRGRQRADLALRADGARNIQRRNDTQLDDRHAARRRDDFAVAGPVLPVGPERVDAHQIRCERHG